MPVPLRGLLTFVVLDSDDSGACTVIDLLSLDDLLLGLRGVPFNFLLLLLDLVNNIGPFIFEALLGHNIIVSPLNTSDPAYFFS